MKNSDIKTRMVKLLALLTALVLVVGSLCAQAAEAAEEEKQSAVQQIDPDRTDCSLELTLEYDKSGEKKSMTGGSISLYTVAKVTIDNGYYFDITKGKFSSVAEIQNLASLDTEALNSQNETLSKALEKAAENVAPDQTVSVANGKVSFSNLTPGLYLVKQNKLSQGDIKINSFLISIPDAEDNYQVAASPKPGISVPDEPTGGDTPTPPVNPPTPIPQTGQLWWPVLLLGVIGILLIVVGVVVRRKRPHHVET